MPLCWEKFSHRKMRVRHTPCFKVPPLFYSHMEKWVSHGHSGLPSLLRMQRLLTHQACQTAPEVVEIIIQSSSLLCMEFQPPLPYPEFQAPEGPRPESLELWRTIQHWREAETCLQGLARCSYNLYLKITSKFMVSLKLGIFILPLSTECLFWMKYQHLTKDYLF